LSDIVTEVDKYKRGWRGGLPETPCGSGSTLAVTEQQREWIPLMVERYGIKSIADVGAGDLNWMKHMDLPGVDYVPYDLVPRDESVVQFDLVNQVPPPVDMVMCLWVLNHFPFEHCRQALANIKASGCQWLMMTDRPIWRNEQPPEIVMDCVEMLVLNAKGDNIQLIELC
jgi:hypothetical protein